MRFSLLAAVAGLALASAAPAEKVDKRYVVEREGTTYDVFEHAESGAKLEFVTNSGICETTPGVNQYSGYLSVGSNMNMWFWFFEARNSPTTAPLAMWLNGGPGCSSMIGLFQENGPCQFYNGSSKPSLNPYSFNEVANMIYVDQPIGTGFSYGTDPVDGTVSAAPYVWKLLQAFYASFPQYENRNFGLFTESYGGHYGPEFADYFEQQNSAGTGIKVPLVALGVNNGWYDPTIQYKAYIDFSYNNSYNKIITSQSQYNSYINKYNNQCVPQLAKCTTTTGNNGPCETSDNTCYEDIEGPISELKNFDVYDVREPSNDPYPPETYVNYINSASVRQAIGAKVSYTECGSSGNAFSNTGDDSRSFLAALGDVVKSGIRVALIAGDADWICNYVGGFGVVNAISWSGQTAFKAKALTSYTVGGQAKGLFKTLNNLSWLQVYAAGHEVPYYQPQAALQYFNQTINQLPLSST